MYPPSPLVRKCRKMYDCNNAIVEVVTSNTEASSPHMFDSQGNPVAWCESPLSSIGPMYPSSPIVRKCRKMYDCNKAIVEVPLMLDSRGNPVAWCDIRKL